ncbi:MAG: ABC transporter permease [Bacteroidota bacterium]
MATAIHGLKEKVRKKIRENVSPPAIKLWFGGVGDATTFTLKFFKELFFPPYEFKEIMIQCYKIGNKSFPLVALTGLIMGLVLTLQSRPVLVQFGAESWLPGMVSLSIIKEIGPVITALICAGKVGSSIGAELGSMKVSEQIDAMEVSAMNPFKFLISTRIIACTVMIPILIIFADVIGMVGSYMAVNIHGKYSTFRFFTQAMSSVEFLDVLPAFIKSVFFGFMIGTISCYKGYNASKGTESVGKAANEAVVASSLSLFIVDMLAVQLTDLYTSL